MVSWGVRDHVVVLKVREGAGYAEPMEDAARLPLKPEQHVIRGVLQQWMESVRWISNDRRVFTREWEKVEEFTTLAGLRQLQAFRAEQDQRQREGLRVQVTVGEFRPIARQSNSYLLKWKEEAFDRLANPVLPQSGLWEATLRVADFQSKTARDEMDLRRKKRTFRNVYGVFVEEIAWTWRPLSGSGAMGGTP